MGKMITARSFQNMRQHGLLKPIIHCAPPVTMVDAAVPLNRELALALSQYKPGRRTLQIERCFAAAIRKLPEEATVKDFDVLFNPNYKIDVLKIMVGVCKLRSFSVIWPGSFDGKRLIYAEEGYADYKAFDINDYDIICVVWEQRSH